MANGFTSVTPDRMLPEHLKTCSRLRPFFERYGLRGCGGTLGRAESIEYFARAHGVDIQQLMDELNDAARDPDSIREETPTPATVPLDELADSIYRRFFKAGIVVGDRPTGEGCIAGARRITITLPPTCAHQHRAQNQARTVPWQNARPPTSLPPARTGRPVSSRHVTVGFAESASKTSINQGTIRSAGNDK